MGSGVAGVFVRGALKAARAENRLRTGHRPAAGIAVCRWLVPPTGRRAGRPCTSTMRTNVRA
ncbi:hypothetical protein ACFPM0_21655 [Pseudonocardia sulfidoxydans]|uniref:hypothetical protein n=1 Tax=Pseudonocardia sulfidoxydans TaxID=54011 RepID=UPI00361D4FC6